MMRPSIRRAIALSDPSPSTGSVALLAVREWPAIAAGWAVAAFAVVLSTALSGATHLIFHFHTIAIATGSAWLYRRLVGERPCTARSVAFLVGLAALLSAAESVLAPQGLVDPPEVAGAIWLFGVGTAGLILLRRHMLAGVSAASVR